jgi:hypothetical protein
MTRFIAALCAAFALMMTSWITVEAQYLPGGSYQGSCRNITMRGPILSAACTGPQGHYHYSSLNISHCPSGTARNINGFLACGVYAPPPPPPPMHHHLPHGSYRMSCTNMFMRGDQLTAVCPSANGTRIQSSIFVRPCRGGDIQNRNGYLACVFP